MRTIEEKCGYILNNIRKHIYICFATSNRDNKTE